MMMSAIIKDSNQPAEAWNYAEQLMYPQSDLTDFLFNVQLVQLPSDVYT